MPNKTEEYLALACKTADSFSRQWEHWAEFLITAARLYKYSYPDQLMIYAQRPDATACAEYDVWNNKMNRYVRRGSKGIALLDESGGYPRLHYVFDVSDTAPRRNALYPDLWQINDSLKEPVRSMLAENYGVHSESFGQQLADVAGKLVQSYWDNNSSDILGIVDGSYFLPNLTLNQPRKQLNRYGRMRRNYLMEQRPVVYSTMLLNGTLYPHLWEVEQTAEKQDATADERTVGEKPGSGQGEKPDGVGAAHEQPESAGGGNDPDRADLQLNFLEAAVPTEAQQIESIDQAESEKSSSAFVLSQADIEKALRRGSNFENSKLRIWEIYQTQPDRKLRAKALAKEYAPHGPGGCSHTYLDGSSGWLDHDSKGLTFEHYPDHQKIFLRWNQVEKYIDLMMQADRYLTDKEKNATELYFELNADSVAEYNALKKQYPDALVGFEQNGQFEFYGEDARKICELTGGKLLERETALGTVLVTGFPREQWVYRAKQLWECGENIYLAGLNEDGMHHQTKYLRREEYLPVGSIVHMEGREFRVDKVDFDKDSVTLQDMALAELRMPIFREAPLAVVRELYEQEPEPPVLVSDGLGLPGEDSNKLPVSIEVNEVPTTPEVAAAEEGLNEEGAPELAGNFRITDEELGAGGPKQKFARNIKAIKTLFTLEQEHRGATAEEQQVLSQYVGWGGLADAFDPDKSSWAKEYAELKGLLSEEEYKAARGSVLNAHYTSPTVIRAIYDAVERMGFRTGNILEPSMGVGNFFGMLPESMADSRLYGVELDSITGRIAQKLYPEANIKVAGFETTDRRDFYDLAVGNVPFGNYKVNDKAYNKLNFSIHNYFFAKAIDQVRPGGIVAFVTSRYTLDSKDSAARKHIAERADLLGAIRLPNNAFRANAGTDVVSDIIFLQKRDRPMDHEPAWVQLGKTEDGISINSYFADHPEMILGKLTTENTQYGKEEATVVPIEGANLADQLREAVRQLEGQYLEAAAEVPDIAETEAERRTLPADPDVKNFSYPQGAGSAHRDRGGAGERTD